jgi:methionine salvage enolase-phosphatase E1
MVEQNVFWQMDQDRKSIALKGNSSIYAACNLAILGALQGHMWSKGYASGELKGECVTALWVTLRKTLGYSRMLCPFLGR